MAANPPRLTPARENEIEQRLAGVMPGEWYGAVRRPRGMDADTLCVVSRKTGRAVALTGWAGAPDHDDSHRHTEFFVAAPADIAALLAEVRALRAELCREQDRCGIIAGHRDDIHKRARQERERIAYLLGEPVDTEQYDEAVDALDERRTAATPAPGAGGHDG